MSCWFALCMSCSLSSGVKRTEQHRQAPAQHESELRKECNPQNVVWHKRIRHMSHTKHRSNLCCASSTQAVLGFEHARIRKPQTREPGINKTDAFCLSPILRQCGVTGDLAKRTGLSQPARHVMAHQGWACKADRCDCWTIRGDQAHMGHPCTLLTSARWR